MRKLIILLLLGLFIVALPAMAQKENAPPAPANQSLNDQAKASWAQRSKANQADSAALQVRVDKQETNGQEKLKADCIEKYPNWKLDNCLVLLAAASAAPQKHIKEKISKHVKKANAYAAQCVQKHPGWTPGDCYRIYEHEVWIGMTADMATASLGAPVAVNSTQTADQATMQVVYERGGLLAFRAGMAGRLAPRVYIYFDSKDCNSEGRPGECKVSSIQETN